MKNKKSNAINSECQCIIFKNNFVFRNRLKKYDHEIIKHILELNISKLGLLEQHLLSLYYLNELTISEIAKVFNIEESEVSDYLSSITQIFEKEIENQLFIDASKDHL